MSRQEILKSKASTITLTKKLGMSLVMTMPWVMTLTVTMGVAIL